MYWLSNAFPCDECNFFTIYLIFFKPLFFSYHVLNQSKKIMMFDFFFFIIFFYFYVMPWACHPGYHSGSDQSHNAFFEHTHSFDIVFLLELI